MVIHRHDVLETPRVALLGEAPGQHLLLITLNMNIIYALSSAALDCPKVPLQLPLWGIESKGVNQSRRGVVI